VRIFEKFVRSLVTLVSGIVMSAPHMGGCGSAIAATLTRNGATIGRIGRSL
jgi:hypothetical protein